MNNTSPPSDLSAPRTLSRGQCILILVVAFLGWLFAGTHMAINGITYHSVATSLLSKEIEPVNKTKEKVEKKGEQETEEQQSDNDKKTSSPVRKVVKAATADKKNENVGMWFGFLVAAFLLGAATGGYVFGWVGDRFGRSKAMAISIACYSIFSFVSAFSQSIYIFWILRFITCMGIGGMWPNGMALIQEAWPNTAKPILAGILGTAANVGIALFAFICIKKDVNPSDWQWTYLVGSSPILLAVLAWILVPESPKWLLQQATPITPQTKGKVGMGEVFSVPHLKLTSIGIVLAFVPLFGGWGVANWANAWASDYDEQVKKQKVVNQAPNETEDKEKTNDAVTTIGKTASNKKAEAAFHRAWPGSISSLLGGALAFLLGRRHSYALLCVLAFTCTQLLFGFSSPSSDSFNLWVGLLGFFSGFFFGWLPLCLPEMFPTRVRSTGSGVSFNFGRIIVAVLVIATSLALKAYFKGSYNQVGQICGFMYLAGIMAVFMMPKTIEASPASTA